VSNSQSCVPPLELTIVILHPNPQSSPRGHKIVPSSRAPSQSRFLISNSESYTLHFEATIAISIVPSCPRTHNRTFFISNSQSYICSSRSQYRAFFISNSQSRGTMAVHRPPTSFKPWRGIPLLMGWMPMLGTLEQIIRPWVTRTPPHHHAPEHPSEGCHPNAARFNPYQGQPTRSEGSPLLTRQQRPFTTTGVQTSVTYQSSTLSQHHWL
jgi:hypothetical protein